MPLKRKYVNLGKSLVTFFYSFRTTQCLIPTVHKRKFINLLLPFDKQFINLIIIIVSRLKIDSKCFNVDIEISYSAQKFNLFPSFFIQIYDWIWDYCLIASNHCHLFAAAAAHIMARFSLMIPIYAFVACQLGFIIC